MPSSSLFRRLVLVITLAIVGSTLAPSPASAAIIDDGNGNLTIDGTSHTVGTGQTLTIAADQTLTIESGQTLTIGGPNSGTSSTSVARLDNAGTIVNNGGLIDIAIDNSGRSTTSASLFANTGTIVNENGIIRITGGIISGTSSTSLAQLVNAGTVTNNGGQININGGTITGLSTMSAARLKNEGTITNNIGEININGATVTGQSTQSTARLDNTGAINENEGEININGADVSGTSSTSAAEFTNSGNGTIDISDGGALRVVNGNLTGTSSFATTSLSNLDDATINNAGTITSEGTLRNRSAITVADGGTMDIRSGSISESQPPPFPEPQEGFDGMLEFFFVLDPFLDESLTNGVRDFSASIVRIIDSSVNLDVRNAGTITTNDGAGSITIESGGKLLVPNSDNIQPVAIKADFEPSVAPGGSTLTLSMNNPNDVTIAVAYTLTLPAGLSAVQSGGTCAVGTVEANGNTIDISSDRVPADGCTRSFTVTGAPNDYAIDQNSITNPSSLTSSVTGTTLTILEPVEVGAAFAETNIASNDDTTLSFNMANPNNVSVPAAFAAALPAGLSAADLAHNCEAGDLDLTSGVVTLANASVQSEGCTVTVTITGDVGTYNLGSDDLSDLSNIDVAIDATLTITAFAPPAPACPRVLAGDFAGESGVRGQLSRLYMASFLRQPDPAGFDHWLTAITEDNGWDLSLTAALFVTSEEFQNTYGDLADEGFIDLLYGNVMCREADTGGRDYWLSQLGDGLDRASLLVLFSESPEFKALTSTN